MTTATLKLSILSGLATVACAFGLHATNLTWDADPLTNLLQDGPGVWDTTTNTWWDGVANVTWNNATPDNAIFGATNGAAGTVTVPSNTTNTVGNITFNTPGSGGYNIAAGDSATSKLELSGNPTINVASGVFATNLVGLSGTSFTKSGAGTFVLKPGVPNINSGPTVVSEGTLIIGSSSGRLVIPGNLTISNGATAQLGQGQQIADSGTLTVDGGTFDMTSRPETLAGVVLDNNGLINASSSSAILTSSGTIDVRSGTIVAGLAGAGGLTKTTGGTVSFAAGYNNTYTGGTLISAGILDTSRSGTGNGIPAGIVTITNTGMLRLWKDNQVSLSATVNVAGGTYELSNHNDNASIVILDNGGQILNGGSQSKTLTVSTNLDFRNGLCASILGGTANLVKSTAGTVTLTMNNLYSGGTLVSGGILQLSDGSSVNRGTLGSGQVTNDAAIVINHSGSFTFTNIISGSGSITNLGGSVTINGDNTYSGGTILTGGTLFVNNTTGSGTGTGLVRVKSGAKLAGTGIIGGAVTVESGGTLSPGTATGTLTVNGNLTLNANSTNNFDVNGSTLANDSVVLGGSVTYGGTLNIVPSGVFTAGQQFVLFSGAGATSANNFSIAGSPGIDLAFNFSNGVLSVVSTSGTPPTLNVSKSGSTLTFSWSETGYKLQSQTNTLAAGLASNWFDYPDTSNPVNVTIDPANPTVFFRLAPQ